MIVAFGGVSGSGKDTAAKFLLQRGFKKVSFAQTIKKITAEFFQIPIDHVEKFKDRPFVSPLELSSVFIPHLQEILITELGVGEKECNTIALFHLNKDFFSLREFMQWIGTDVGRKLFKEDIWVEATLRHVPELAVFTDVRFPNELEALKSIGATTIYVERGGHTQLAPEHISERALSAKDFDRTLLNNGTIHQLGRDLLSVLD